MRARLYGITEAEAWDGIKADISRGELQAQCLDDRGQRAVFEAHWIGFLARFLASDPPRTTPDFPIEGMVWFDRTTAVRNRLARAITADNRAECSLPPIRARDLTIEAVRIEELYRADMSQSPHPQGASVKRRPGPLRGTVDRFTESDLKLLPDLERIMSEGKLSRSAAAKKLADAGQIKGPGTSDSRARRLVRRYRLERSKATR